MAVITREGKLVGANGMSQQVNQSNQSSSVSSDRVELIPITLEELKKKGLLGVTIAMDLEEDAWEFSAPPPKGKYTLRLYLGQKGLVYGYTDPKNPKDKDLFVNAGLECRVVSNNPDYNNSVVFANCSTRVYRGKQISTMMGLVAKGLGPNKIPKKELNVYDQVALFSQFLKREPTLDVDLDWRGSYRLADGSYENALKHYEDFPKDPENPNGPRIATVNITRKDGGNEEVRAQVFVDYWYGKGETVRIKKEGDKVGGVNTPLQFVNPTVSTAKEKEKEKEKVNGPVQESLPLGNTSSSVTSDDDLALMLSD